MNYTKRTDNKSVFTNQVFKKFTDACGGSPQDFANTLYSRYCVESFFLSDDYKFHTILSYFQNIVIPHKIAVFESGMEIVRTLSIKIDKELFLHNLWIHDMSKFSAHESLGYAFHDFISDEEDLAFTRAWLHHKNHNPHHPEYWIDIDRMGSTTALDMPLIYICEMIADWTGAGRVYGSDINEWLPKNFHKFYFSKTTSTQLKETLNKLGIKYK